MPIAVEKVFGFPVLPDDQRDNAVARYSSDHNMEGVELRRLKKGKFRKFSTVLNKRKIKLREARFLKSGLRRD